MFGKWIPVKWHKDANYMYHLDTKMPKDGERVLVTRKFLTGYTVADTIYSESELPQERFKGYNLSDIIAWMPYPDKSTNIWKPLKANFMGRFKSNDLKAYYDYLFLLRDGRVIYDVLEGNKLPSEFALHKREVGYSIHDLVGYTEAPTPYAYIGGIASE